MNATFAPPLAFNLRLPVNILAALLAMTTMGKARPNIRDAFFTTYPAAVGSKLDNLPSKAGHCAVCHFDVNGGGTKNPYGNAILNSGQNLNKESGRLNAVRQVANLDSDSDSYTTATEVTAAGYSNTPTFPGLSSANVGQVIGVPTLEVSPYVTPTTTVDNTPPVVTVLTPNGGESLTANQAYNVAWSATDASGIAGVHIYLSIDGGTTYTPLALGLGNSGVYSWIPANRPTTTALIRVVAVDSATNSAADASNAVFTIVSPLGGKVPTTLRDFDMPGTQPFEGGPEPTPPSSCAQCHGSYDVAVEPYHNWQGSMMAQASRDPLFEANLAIANQDAPESGDLCLRCHNSSGWLQGRSVPTDGSRMLETDRIGVSCDLCHRMVDPVYKLNTSPSRDSQVLADLEFPGTQYGNGMYVLDPSGIQRGPFTDAVTPHQFIASPFHRSAAFCGTCHDVSNPAFTKDSNGVYQPNPFNTTGGDISAHSAGPVERTFSEWSNSQYNTASGVFQPVFAGNKADGMVSTCQDCHMHDVAGKGCNVAGAPTRTDLPLHDMTGGSTWVPNIIASLYPTEATALQAGITRARTMLANAAGLSASLQGGKLVTRVTNQTGHKLPTGYPEGRRIWINVKFFNAANVLVGESAAYDSQTGILARDSEAKVYEVHPGIGANISSVIDMPTGPSLHFVLNNQIYEDNRIPPRGFTNAAFAAFGGAPVGHSYADGQYWDESAYTLPAGAKRAEIRLYYQSTSKEFVEFLRDENHTNSKGLEMYNLWNNNNKCSPELMAQTEWTAPPLEFAGLTGATAGVESAILSWPEATGGCPPVTYSIYQSTISGAQDFATPVMTTTDPGALVGPLDPGSNNLQTYYFVVRATDTCGGVASNTVELPVQPLLAAAKDQDHDGMTNELEQRYGTNPFDSADALQDADLDGLSNLAEAALGSSPKDPADAHWPQGKWVWDAGSRYFALSYSRLANNPAADIVAEVSATLDTWESGVTRIHEVFDEPDGTQTVTERMINSMDASTSGFMRLRIVPK